MAVKVKIAPARSTAPQTSAQPISAELEVRIRKRFPNPEGSFILNVHFRALAGFTILFGASGAGKTTLLDCIAGLTDPDDGRIAVGGEDVYDSEKKRNVAAWKRRIGYVHQDLALFPHLNAEENVAYGLRALRASERKERSREMLAAFRIEHLRDRRPAHISGGERQRVALARALVTQPRALMLDEPLAALDRPTKSSLVSDLRAWNQHHRVPILFVTHNGEEVFALGDEVIVLDEGKIVAQGQPHWEAVVRFTLNALVAAEELGVTQANVDAQRSSQSPDVQRLLGVTGDFGTKLGLANDWAYKAIKAVGNYGDIWERNVGTHTPLRLERGRNALVGDGGLMMSIPVR